MLLSLPMLAKYSGLHSVRDLGYEMCIVKMRPGTTTADSDKVVEDVYSSQDEHI